MNVKNKRKHALRSICIAFSIVIFIITAICFFLMRCESVNEADILGYRICAVKDDEHTTLQKGDLAIVKKGLGYTNGSQVEVREGAATRIVSAGYAHGEIIGVCVSVIHGAGAFFGFIAQTSVISSLLIILFTALCISAALLSDSETGKIKQSKLRLSAQFMFAAVTNSYLAGFAKGTIYKGKLKSICVPGLNCYSCPGAYGACPIGSLQAMFTKRNYGTGKAAPAAVFPLYVLGLIMLFGVVCGRLICGLLCPFGLVQDLLHKIPIYHKLKIKTFPGDRMLRYMKYIILLVFVVLLPIFTPQAFPWFCKLICPSGMLLGGIPLMAANEGLRSAAGGFTVLKLAVVFVTVILSMMIFRPFCKYLCPLGALYAVMNKFSFYGYVYDKSKCTSCGACEKGCEMGVDITKNINSAECIRCGKCVAACKTGELKRSFNSKKKLNNQ